MFPITRVLIGALSSFISQFDAICILFELSCIEKEHSVVNSSWSRKSIRNSLDETKNKARRIMELYEQKWPEGSEWHQEKPGDHGDINQSYPKAVQHPTRGTNEGWKKKVGAVGPIGLMIESILRTGSKISDDFIIHQPKEQNIDILNVPFQFLTDLINGIGQRARTIADRRTKRTKLALMEIDVEATKRDKKLSNVEATGGWIWQRRLSKDRWKLHHPMRLLWRTSRELGPHPVGLQVFRF